MAIKLPIDNSVQVNASVAAINVGTAIVASAVSLNGAPYTATSTITGDYILNRISMLFSTALLRIITITRADGTILYSKERTSKNINLEFNEAFNSGDNFTINIGATAGACTMTLKANILQ